MPNIHRPRRGSLAYSPRKRAKSPVPRYGSWPEHTGAPTVQGFAGYKVGMTHVIMVDDRKNSPTEGKDIMVPVTVVEVPPMRVAGVRAYSEDTYGKHALTEAWATDLDPELSRRINVPKNHDTAAALEAIRNAIGEGKVVELYALTYTRPIELTGVPKKVPDLMEMRIAGGSLDDQIAYAAEILGKEVTISSNFEVGEYVDVTAVTTGKGTEGPVKRWGVQVRKRKHSRGGKKRHIGNLGPWNPHHVRWQVPQMGQMGYQQRTEFNKRILKIGTNGDDITPAGGFLHYGLVRGPYVLIKGSVPGPSKRLVRIRPAIRKDEQTISAPTINFVSTQSKQG
ncbi:MULTISPECIES: 50S ribosomal protein L3 [Methanoculleus]|jgi:large subunit ribosomal protein L3|uniref:Large ribosomal subunit protein uL3 n=1 Tax=Methanoculleus thermophilus TaxID=2200 RepID=A0A1G8ZLH3_9EURY|nr:MULTISPECIES: 50S ribosomal protein L3 [Methanoculleus]NLN09652.1 50S ribosomal protein L3 [Methanoculleus thermophilus]SDK14990.1 LSU ribosomal protein L3P [Methanoculleus thermophilus]HQD25202.1 50S ribosomal protein L3 [Methanoculleus thermophilus]